MIWQLKLKLAWIRASKQISSVFVLLNIFLKTLNLPFVEFDKMKSIIFMSILVFGCSRVYSSIVNNRNPLEEPNEDTVLNERLSSPESTLNQTITDLNEILSYLVNRIEYNPSLLHDHQFFKGFISLINRITNITENLVNLRNRNKIDNTIEENLKILNSFKNKFNDLMKSYVKTTLKPLNNSTDITSTESIDYWNIIWKLIDKIDNQISKLNQTKDSNPTTEAMGFIRPSDPLRNMVIMKVLTQIKDQLASNDTLAQINKALTLKDLIAKVVDVVDKTFAVTTIGTTPRTTRRTATTRPPPISNGIINSIFSRIKNVFGNQRASIAPNIMTTPSIAVTENKDETVKDIISHVINQILKEGLIQSPNQ